MKPLKLNTRTNRRHTAVPFCPIFREGRWGMCGHSGRKPRPGLSAGGQNPASGHSTNKKSPYCPKAGCLACPLDWLEDGLEGPGNSWESSLAEMGEILMSLGHDGFTVLLPGLRPNAGRGGRILPPAHGTCGLGSYHHTNTQVLPGVSSLDKPKLCYRSSTCQQFSWPPSTPECRSGKARASKQ